MARRFTSSHVGSPPSSFGGGVGEREREKEGYKPKKTWETRRTNERSYVRRPIRSFDFFSFFKFFQILNLSGCSFDKTKVKG